MLNFARAGLSTSFKQNAKFKNLFVTESVFFSFNQANMFVKKKKRYIQKEKTPPPLTKKKWR